MERAKPGPDRRPRGALETLEREEERALEDLERSLARPGTSCARCATCASSRGATPSSRWR